MLSVSVHHLCKSLVTFVKRKTDGRKERQRERGRNEEGRKLRKLKTNPSVPLTLTQTHADMHTHQRAHTHTHTHTSGGCNKGLDHLQIWPSKDITRALESSSLESMINPATARLGHPEQRCITPWEASFEFQRQKAEEVPLKAPLPTHLHTRLEAAKLPLTTVARASRGRRQVSEWKQTRPWGGQDRRERGEGEQVCSSTELSERLLRVTFCPLASMAISFRPPSVFYLTHSVQNVEIGSYYIKF